MAEAENTELSQLFEGPPSAEPNLPKAARAERYRRLASEAFQRAEESTDDELRSGYLSLASGWHSLASELERPDRAGP
jgi:hypothetical protein